MGGLATMPAMGDLQRLVLSLANLAIGGFGIKIADAQTL
jgi:hypothetical protein